MSDLHSIISGSLSFEFLEDKQHENCATQRRTTVDTSNMNGSNSSSLHHDERRQQQDNKLQAPPLMLSGGDAELPAADTSALAAMALGMGMDVTSPLIGSSPDGTYATAMQPQGGGTSNSSAGPSLVYGHNSATGLLVDTSSPELGNGMTENSFNQG